MTDDERLGMLELNLEDCRDLIRTQETIIQILRERLKDTGKEGGSTQTAKCTECSFKGLGGHICSGVRH